MNFYHSSVGKKVVMATSGCIVFGYVIAHLVGNLQIFTGPEKINEYAYFLKGLGGALWLFRIVLLSSIGLHIIAAVQVTLQSWQARPHGYIVSKYKETTYAARTMRWGGPIIALFIVYHLLHLTTGHLHPNSEAFTHIPGQVPNVYNNVVYGFQVWWTSAVYILAIVAVAFHLYHGVWSMLQTVGINHPRWNNWRRFTAFAFALFVIVSGVSIPVAVMTGLLKPV